MLCDNTVAEMRARFAFDEKKEKEELYFLKCHRLIPRDTEEGIRVHSNSGAPRAAGGSIQRPSKSFDVKMGNISLLTLGFGQRNFFVPHVTTPHSVGGGGEDGSKRGHTPGLTTTQTPELLSCVHLTTYQSVAPFNHADIQVLHLI